MQVVATMQDEKDSYQMSCAPNIRSLRFDENIASIERTIHVAWLHKGCFQNGMLLCILRILVYSIIIIIY